MSASMSTSSSMHFVPMSASHVGLRADSQPIFLSDVDKDIGVHTNAYSTYCHIERDMDTPMDMDMDIRIHMDVYLTNISRKISIWIGSRV